MPRHPYNAQNYASIIYKSLAALLVTPLVLAVLAVSAAYSSFGLAHAGAMFAGAAGASSVAGLP